MKNPSSPYKQYQIHEDNNSYRVPSNNGTKLLGGFRSYMPSPKINSNLMIANHTLL